MPLKQIAAVLLLLASCDAPASTTIVTGTGPTTSNDATTTEAPSTSTPVEEVRRASDYLHPSLLVVPLGHTAELGVYDVTLIDVVADATEAVLAENPSIERPPEGEEFVLLKLRIIYRGEASGIPGIDLGLVPLVVPDNLSLMECGTYPDSLMDIPELFSGEQEEANVCVSVPSNGINRLMLEVNPQTEPRFRPQAERRQFFETVR